MDQAVGVVPDWDPFTNVVIVTAMALFQQVTCWNCDTRIDRPSAAVTTAPTIQFASSTCSQTYCKTIGLLNDPAARQVRLEPLGIIGVWQPDAFEIQ